MKNSGNKEISQKIAIIIGATSGIGKCLVPLLISKGYKLGITGRRLHILEEISAQYPGRVSFSCFDISETETALSHLEKLVAALGGLDLFLISAGTGDLNESLDYEPEKRTIDTNVSGFTLLAGWACKYFSEKRSGHLAAITSVAGLRGNRIAPAYNASKAFQINYLEGLRAKYAHENRQITVTDIRPGFVDTEMAKGDGKFWVAKPEKAAQQILRGILKKRTIIYVTRRWRLIAIILKMIPRCLMNRM